MTSLPGPPKTKSLPPRLRTSSSPFSPANSSVLSVPLSRPPCGQPGRSFEVKRAGKFTLIFRVPWHRASSFLEACACTPEAPTVRTATHPIRKATTKAMRCPRRTTTHPPPLMCPLLLAPRSMPHNEAHRISTEAYSPKCAEGVFSELRIQRPAYPCPYPGGGRS